MAVETGMYGGAPPGNNLLDLLRIFSLIDAPPPTYTGAPARRWETASAATQTATDAAPASAPSKFAPAAKAQTTKTESAPEDDAFTRFTGWKPGPNVVGGSNVANAPGARGPNVVGKSTVAEPAAAEDDAFTRFTGYKPNPAAASQAASAEDDAFTRFTGYKSAAGHAPETPKETTTDELGRSLGVMRDANGLVSTYDPATGEIQQQFTPEMWAAREKAIEANRTPAWGAFAQGAASGVPIVGPYAQMIPEYAAAVTRAARNDTPISQELQNVRDLESRQQQEHPWAEGAGRVTGGALGYAQLASIPGVAPMLGMGGGTVAGRMFAGGVSNALIGGTDAAARGEDKLSGALWGGVGGALAPPVGEVAGAAFRGLTNATGRVVNRLLHPIDLSATPLERPAANLLSQSVAADEPQFVQANLGKYGEGATLADAGANLQDLAGGLAARPGEAKSVLTRFLDARKSGMTGRLNSELDSQLGPAEDPSAVTAAIRAERSNVDYSAVHAAAPPVDVSDVIDTIDTHLAKATGNQKAALENFRSQLVKEPEKTLPNGTVVPETYQDDSEILHNIRQDMDAKINYGDPRLGIQPGALARANGSAKVIRGELDSALKTQVPGMREADAKSAMLANRAEAVESGTKVLGAGESSPWPETFANERAAMPVGQQLAQNKTASNGTSTASTARAASTAARAPPPLAPPAPPEAESGATSPSCPDTPLLEEIFELKDTPVPLMPPPTSSPSGT